MTKVEIKSLLFDIDEASSLTISSIRELEHMHHKGGYIPKRVGSIIEELYASAHFLDQAKKTLQGQDEGADAHSGAGVA